jgi:hypothetical protein
MHFLERVRHFGICVISACITIDHLHQKSGVMCAWKFAQQLPSMRTDDAQSCMWRRGRDAPLPCCTARERVNALR